MWVQNPSLEKSVSDKLEFLCFLHINALDNDEVAEMQILLLETPFEHLYFLENELSIPISLQTVLHWIWIIIDIDIRLNWWCDHPLLDIGFPIDRRNDEFCAACNLHSRNLHQTIGPFCGWSTHAASFSTQDLFDPIG